jgi:hypothetical protein
VIVRRAAAIAALALVGAAVSLLAVQRRLLYFPERQDLARATRAAERDGLQPWRDASGAFLGWAAPHPSGTAVARAIAFHGNAGSALDRAYLRDVLQGEGVPPVDFYHAEYPGYGPREGAPAQPAILAAALDAIDLLAQGGGGPVLLVGESLGSAVAALAAAERPGVAGVLLLTPLSSVEALARRHYPFIPGFLVLDRWRADLALPRYGGPVVFVVAERDEIVFPDLGLALHAAYPGPKRLVVERAATHNALRYDPGDPRWGEIVRFLLEPGAAAAR